MGNVFAEVTFSITAENSLVTISIRIFLRILENIPRRMVSVSFQSIDFEGGGTMGQVSDETSLS